jgi:hypothetical protein
LYHPNIIIDVHINKALENEIIMWAVGVKLNGSKAIRFIIIIAVNVVIIIIINPFLLWFDSKGFNSFFIGLIIIMINLFNFWFLFILGIKNHIGINIISHIECLIAIEGSNMENKLFIIFIFYF